MISTKEAIVFLLSVRFPLTAKQLSVLLRKQHGLSVSYQAVHKALTQLVSEGVLKKTKQHYQLSEAWIKKKKSEIGAIEAKYFQKAPSLALPQENLVFDSLFEVDKFLIGSFVSIASKMNKKPVLCLRWSHFWIPLLLSKKEYAKLVEFAHLVEAYCLSKGNTPIDKWCAVYWKKHGWKHKLGVDVASSADIVVFGDYVIQVFYPAEIRKMLENVYNKTKRVSDLDVDYFFNKIFEKKTKIPVIVLKNAELAEQLRKQTIKIFRQANQI